MAFQQVRFRFNYGSIEIRGLEYQKKEFKNLLDKVLVEGSLSEKNLYPDNFEKTISENQQLFHLKARPTKQGLKCFVQSVRL